MYSPSVLFRKMCIVLNSWSTLRPASSHSTPKSVLMVCGSRRRRSRLHQLPWKWSSCVGSPSWCCLAAIRRAALPHHLSSAAQTCLSYALVIQKSFRSPIQLCHAFTQDVWCLAFTPCDGLWPVAQELLPTPPQSADGEEAESPSTDDLPLLEAEALLVSMHFLGKTAADSAAIFAEANLAELNKRYQPSRNALLNYTRSYINEI